MNLKIPITFAMTILLLMQSVMALHLPMCNADIRHTCAPHFHLHKRHHEGCHEHYGHVHHTKKCEQNSHHEHNQNEIIELSTIATINHRVMFDDFKTGDLHFHYTDISKDYRFRKNTVFQICLYLVRQGNSASRSPDAERNSMLRV